MKTKNPVQVRDLRFQVDLIILKKNQFLDENRNNPGNARLFVLLVGHRELEMISDGNKNTEVNLF